MDGHGGRDEIEKFHVSKRARYSNTSVVVSTTMPERFRKRRNKRRQIAAEQVAAKDRQKRLQERRERRQALKEAMEEASKSHGGEEDGDANAEEEREEGLEEAAPVARTVTYDMKETMTVVNVTRITPGTDDDEEEKDTRASLDRREACVATTIVKVKKPKFRKPRRPQSEKRTRKLTRREKSVPKNLRTKKRKRK